MSSIEELTRNLQELEAAKQVILDRQKQRDIKAEVNAESFKGCQCVAMGCIYATATSMLAFGVAGIASGSVWVAFCSSLCVWPIVAFPMAGWYGRKLEAEQQKQRGSGNG